MKVSPLPSMLLPLAAAAAACHLAGAPPAEDPTPEAAPAPRPLEESVEEPLEPWPLFGAELETDAEPIAFEALLDRADERAGSRVQVEGTVESVCPVKGCWMVLSDGEREMRVTFADYGFFVPKDIAGRRVRCEGVLSVEEVGVDEARHYLEDAGRHEEAARITEPVPSFLFEATGVEVEPAPDAGDGSG